MLLKTPRKAITKMPVLQPSAEICCCGLRKSYNSVAMLRKLESCIQKKKSQLSVLPNDMVWLYKQTEFLTSRNRKSGCCALHCLAKVSFDPPNRSALPSALQAASWHRCLASRRENIRKLRSARHPLPSTVELRLGASARAGTAVPF